MVDKRISVRLSLCHLLQHTDGYLGNTRRTPTGEWADILYLGKN